jgi:membrane-bound ClpP family serine protease
VKVNGELWRARAEEEELLRDQPIEVVDIEGLTLVVRR